MKTLTLLILLLNMTGDRNGGIEIHFTNGIIPHKIKDKYDIEFSSKENSDILWIHPDGWKAFDIELFDYLSHVTKVYNRATGTDHLNLFVEVDEMVDKYGVEIYTPTGIRKFKNIRWSEIGEYNLETDPLYTKQEVNNLNKI